MSALRFSKYEGIGNDFVVVDSDGGPDARVVSPADALAICDRHFGVGADGILLAGVKGDVPFMRMLNPDGSEPEMCGNGLRCVVLHLLRRGHVLGDSCAVDTGAGPHAVRVVRRGDRLAVVEVAMRVPSFAPADVPVASPTPLIGATIVLGDGRELRGTAVSMGNPHFVTFGTFDRATREALGPLVQALSLFPHGVNVGFAQRADAGGGTTGEPLVLDVLERGAGWTLGCGTGACAAAAAAVQTGLARRGVPIDVRQPGGVLSVVIGEPGTPVKMTGPARHVFDGEWPR